LSSPVIYTGAVYLPAFRLEVEGARSRRAVASYDEDTTSMGVEAARRALAAVPTRPERLLFTTTSPAYLEKNAASTIHAALGLPSGVAAYDAAGAHRSAVGALLSALEAGRPTLAITADLQVGPPGSAEERERGDGAAAMLAGPSDAGPAVAELVGHGSATLEVMERWRLPGEATAQASDERLLEAAYRDVTREAVQRALEAACVEATAIARAAVAGVTARVVRAAAATAPVPREAWIGSSGGARIASSGGPIASCGAAQPIVELLRLLEAGRPGELALLLTVADGADALVLRRREGSVPAAIEGAGRELPYLTYLTWRGLLPPPGSRRPDPPAPAPAPALRNRRWKFALTASRCRECGFVSLPPQEVCPGCGRRGSGVPYELASRQGTVVSATADLLARGASEPPLMTALVDLDGGGRGRFELTDVWAGEVRDGDRVELTFRRLHSSGGVHDYFWKARPVAATSE
jgi:hydroxymethylglutaryl-CoA synthase